jgi:hypothetical protein
MIPVVVGRFDLDYVLVIFDELLRDKEGNLFSICRLNDNRKLITEHANID